MGEPGEDGFVDENGMPIELPYDSRPPEMMGPMPPPAGEGPVRAQHWNEEQTGRRPPPDNGAPPGNGSAPTTGGQPQLIKEPTARPPPATRPPTQRPPARRAPRRCGNGS